MRAINGGIVGTRSLWEQSRKTRSSRRQNNCDDGDSFGAVETERMSADQNWTQYVDRVGQNHNHHHGLGNLLFNPAETARSPFAFLNQYLDFRTSHAQHRCINRCHQARKCQKQDDGEN